MATRLLFASNFYLYSFPHQPKPPYHHVHGYECLWVIPVHRFWVVFLPVSLSRQPFPLSIYQVRVASSTDSLIKSHRSRQCITQLLSNPWWALRTSRFILKGTPLIISWFASSQICVFRTWNSIKLSYDSQTYPAEPLGTQDLNLDHQLQEDDGLYGDQYSHTLYLPCPSTSQYSLDSPTNDINQALGWSSPLPQNASWGVAGQDSFGYEVEVDANPPLGDSDWNGIVDGSQRGIYGAPDPFIAEGPDQSTGGSTATVSVSLVNAACEEVAGQDIFVGSGEGDEETPLSMLWDGGQSLDDFCQELLSPEYEDHSPPPIQGALVTSAPQQPSISDGNNLGIAFTHTDAANIDIMSMGSQEDQGYFQEHDDSPDLHSEGQQRHLIHPPQLEPYDEGAFSQYTLAENMQAFPVHTPPQPVLPSILYHRLEQSDDNLTAPVASSSSSSHGGVLRTTRTAPRHRTVYTRPDSFPRTVPESHNPNYQRWSCQWDGCNAIFSSFKELKNHVLRPNKDGEHTVSVHRLPRGNSKEMHCCWGNCSANLNGIWRHILSDVHVFIRYRCSTCGVSRSRQRRPPPGRCC